MVCFYPWYKITPQVVIVAVLVLPSPLGHDGNNMDVYALEWGSVMVMFED